MTRYCLQCDDGTQLVHMHKDVTVMYRDKSAIVANIEGWHCLVCGECEFVNESDSRRHMEALNNLVGDYKTEESKFVRNVRKKLGLKQVEAAKLFGGGVNAFSEYERGITQPHKSTIALLKLLNNHPELLSEVRMV
ncbi:MAG: type II toxin-antitoxin system MqsA family antitoxin [Moraxellaceae bacterium]|nr:type II toxin-antitoxin system MqsA family antitoxin [Moraxellaceae bacterium]